MSPPSVPARMVAAVDLLGPQPADAVLEVGGGSGVSAALICGRLGSGRLVALDRSSVAGRRNARRNADHHAAGRLEILTGELADLDEGIGPFDRALALNVNAFWTGPADAELAALRRVLKPGGLVVLAWGGGGPQRPSRIVDAATAGLVRHGFLGLEPIRDPRLVGVTARAR